MRRAATLLIAMLVLTSVDAAEVRPAAQAAEDCAPHVLSPAAIKPGEAKGRMPVRGMSHFAAIYARSLSSTDESTAAAGDHAVALANTGGSRS